jgi:hypothetical protein
MDPPVVTLRFRGVRPTDVSPYRLRRSRFALSRFDESIRCALRYSDGPTRPGAEAPERLSCGCAHFRVHNPTRPAWSAATFPILPRPTPKSRTHPNRPDGVAGQLSWSLVPLRRSSPSESTPPRFAKAGYVPPTGFFALSTVCSSLGRPALFHAGDVHGVSLFREFPSLPGSVARRDENTLLALLLRTGCQPIKLANNISCGGAMLHGPVPRQSPFAAFRALLQQRVRSDGTGVTREPIGRAPPELLFASPRSIP